MSIFDTLRYPISDSPTEEELADLPTQLRLDWFNWVLIEHRKQDPSRILPIIIDAIDIEITAFFLSWLSEDNRKIYIKELRSRIANL